VADRADERGGADQVRGYGGGSLVLPACQIQLLNRFGLPLVAVAAGQVVIKVAVLSAHAADVEGQFRTGCVDEVGGVLADGERDHRDDVELTQRRVASCRALGQRGAQTSAARSG
jgi:hypothetical protein